MPKRVPKSDTPFRPVEAKLLDRVMQGGGGARVVESKPPASLPEDRPAGAAPAAQEEPRRETVVPLPANEPPAAAPSAQKPTVKPRRARIERFALSGEEKSGLTQLVNELSLKLDASIKPSNLHRALHVLLQHSKEEIIRRAAQRQGHLQRPGNDNHVGMAEFEQELARIISLGLKDAPTLREV